MQKVMAKKKEKEEPQKVMALIDGELVEVEHVVTAQVNKTNEPLDRSRITDETKKELAVLLKKLPEIKPVVEILIGKAATQELE